jgi:hypothetical protein
MTGFPGGLLWLRRGPCEIVASIRIALGAVMPMQPFAISALGRGFALILNGTATFIIASRFRRQATE